MRTDCQIAAAELTDIPEVLMLMRQYWTFENIDGFDPLRLSQLLKQLISQRHLGFAWVAREREVLVGYLIVVLVFSMEYRGLIAEIDEIFILPQVRGLGIGAALVSRAECALAAAGCTFIQLQLGVANDAARAFYERRGYAPRKGFELLGMPLPAVPPPNR
jgi:GNAT superfamily N-acetyltransferase